MQQSPKSYPQLRQPQRGSLMKRLPILLLLVFFLVACGSTTIDTSLPIDQQINQAVQGAGATGSNIVSSYDGGNKVEVIDENIAGDSSDSDTINTIKADCFAFQKALWTSSVASQLSDVSIRVNTQVKDPYGHISNSSIGNCELPSATAQQFQWANLNDNDAWKVYDRAWLLPSLSQG
jgi:hypothetical protein